MQCNLEIVILYGNQFSAVYFAGGSTELDILCNTGCLIELNWIRYIAYHTEYNYSVGVAETLLFAYIHKLGNWSIMSGLSFVKCVVAAVVVLSQSWVSRRVKFFDWGRDSCVIARKKVDFSLLDVRLAWVNNARFDKNCLLCWNLDRVIIILQVLSSWRLLTRWQHYHQQNVAVLGHCQQVWWVNNTLQCGSLCMSEQSRKDLSRGVTRHWIMALINDFLSMIFDLSSHAASIQIAYEFGSKFCTFCYLCHKKILPLSFQSGFL